jgi:hypothetical protein
MSSGATSTTLQSPAANVVDVVVGAAVVVGADVVVEAVVEVVAGSVVLDDVAAGSELHAVTASTVMARRTRTRRMGGSFLSVCSVMEQRGKCLGPNGPNAPAPPVPAAPAD